MQFRISAQFDKYDIPAVAELKGLVNSERIYLGGQWHGAGEIRFLQYCGRHIGDQVYQGELEFETIGDVDDDAPSADFGKLKEGHKEIS